MTGLIFRSGLLSILLVLVGSLASWAAPLVEHEGITTSQTTHDNFRECKEMEVSTYAVKMAPWEKICRPTSSTNTPAEVGLQLYYPDVVWGDMFSQAQLMVDASFQCLSRTNAGLSDLKYVCSAMGMPWMHSVTSISTISETFHSLYEYMLPEEEYHKDTVGGMKLSYSGKQFLRYRGTALSDWSEISPVPNMAPIMQLLLFLFPEQDFRNLGTSDSVYQIEMSDTLTRFIPMFPIQTRRLELGDLIPYWYSFFSYLITRNCVVGKDFGELA